MVRRDQASLRIARPAEVKVRRVARLAYAVLPTSGEQVGLTKGELLGLKPFCSTQFLRKLLIDVCRHFGASIRWLRSHMTGSFAMTRSGRRNSMQGRKGPSNFGSDSGSALHNAAIIEPQSAF